MPKIKGYYSVIIFILVISLFTGGCDLLGGKSKKPEPAEQKPQAPPVLEKMLENIENIIAEVAQKSKMPGLSSLQRSAQAEQGQPGSSGQKTSGGVQEDSQKQQESSGDQAKGEGEEKKGQQGGSESNQMLMQAADWQKEETKLRNLHRHWNTLEPQAIKAGLSSDERDKFESNLNQLTRQISDKNIEESILAAVNLYMNYSELVRVFSADIPAEYYRAKYEIMSAIIKAGSGEWAAAANHASKAQERWNSFKNQIKGKNEESITQTEFAIQDLILAINSQDFDLVMIKGEVLMYNLQKL